MMVNASPNFIAQAIQTGNSSAQSSVQTNIQGNGSVSTHIEVSANGEKKVLDSNSPGTYKLEVQSNNNNNSDQNITPIISLFPIPTATPTSTLIPKKTEAHKSSFLSDIEKNIQKFLGKISGFFKFK